MTTAIAKTEGGAALATTPGDGDFQNLWALSDVLLKSNFLPSSIKTTPQCVAVILTGRELGVPPMQALRQIAIINGKPCVGAELMLALIYAKQGNDAVRFERTDATECVISYKRQGWPDRKTFAFTAEDAKRAGLLAKAGVWTQYPAAMLRARCVSAMARLAYPDVICGMYTPEELGAEVMVSPDGEVTMSETPPAPAELDAVDEERKLLLDRCRDAAITLGKDRLKAIRKGRTPDKLETPDLQAFAEELEAAVKTLQAEGYTSGVDSGDLGDYTPGEEG